MKKKITLGLGALAVALVALPMFAAFEAHVINVTAKIENALQVDTTPINFGTVFPQEYLEKTLSIWLSQSFLDEPDADDVDYIIRQKPKCGVTEDNGEKLVGPTWTGHVSVDAQGNVQVDCDKDKPEDLQLQSGQTAGLLPMLCPYLSKHPDGVDDNNATGTTGATNDGSTPAFHHPFSVDPAGNIVWLDTKGRLAKSESDEHDHWIIDLAVPCFGDHCAQDWATFVGSHNPNADPDEWKLDKSLEHKVFGCNLWVEVEGVSRRSDQD